MRDLNGREVLALAPIAALCLLLGVWTQPFLDSVKPDLQVVGRIADGAKDRAAGWNAPAAGPLVGDSLRESPANRGASDLPSSAPVAAVSGGKAP